jgi:penicillin-binding protein 1A
MGKTGTTSDFHDALFVGSTYGRQGITVAVRIGFDDNRTLGERETGGLTALPIFREVMLHVYERQLVGPVPQFPSEIEDRIDEYLARQAALKISHFGSPPEMTLIQSSAGRQRVAASSSPNRIPGSVNAMKSGPVDFLAKPIDDRALLGAIERAVPRALQDRREQAITRDVPTASRP